MSKQDAVKKLKALKSNPSQSDIDEIIILVEGIVEAGTHPHKCPSNYIVSGELDGKPAKYVVLATDEQIARRAVTGLNVRASQLADDSVKIS
jgi:hypothetical protein